MDASARLTAALVGRYVIEKEAGVGGMATVYVARDIRHDRRVALKVLHPDLAAALGTERFLAEIRTTANLQHPHILPLHDSGEADGFLFYVMPFVEGETLRARLTREQQLPMEDALRIAREVLSALDYAHRHGVIHRDIKPENILLHDGSALVADFGIALAVTAAGGQRMTQTGLSLGTPQYMSPEQAMGDKNIDGRADIYAAGAVLYEMLTGEPPFSGASVQAIVAKVITERPTPPRTVRDTIAPHVELSVLRALAKLPADRFTSAAQFAEALGRDTFASTTPYPHAASPRRPTSSRRALIAVSLAAALLGIAGATGWWKATHPTPAAPIRFALTLGPNEVLMDPIGRSIAVSPDGRLLAYFASDGARRGIHVRDLGESQGRAIAETDAANDARFSPDGRSIAYYTGFSGREPRGIFTIPVTGSPAALVRGAPSSWQGMAWTYAEPIVYASTTRLWKVSSRGGPPEAIVTPDSGAALSNLGDPFILPDGKTVSFRVATPAGQRLGLGDMAGGRYRILDLEGSNVIGYVDGWLVFGQGDGTIAAAKVNLANGAVTSDVVHVMAGVRVGPNTGISAAMSRDGGTLAFLSGSVGRSLVIVDEHGRTLDTGPEKLHYEYPAWSPDGKRIVADVSVPTGGRRSNELRVLDVEARTLSRIAADIGSRTRAIWTPDGKRVAYVRTSRPGKPPGIYWIRADGSAPEEMLVQGQFRHISFARDGRLFAIGTDRTSPDTLRATGIWVLDPSGVVPATPVITGLARLVAPAVSPDGRWLAYQSEETARPEVYVRSLSADGTRVQITTGGGVEPRWSPDGSRIYYRNGTGTFLAATIVENGGSIAVVRRDSLFRDRYASFDGTNPDYDVHPDGRRFVFLDHAAEIRVEVVVNWLTELRAKLAAANRE